MWLDLMPKVLQLHVGPHLLRARLTLGRRVLAQAERSGPAAPSAAALGKCLSGLLATLAEQSALRGARAEVELADALVLLDVVGGEFADHGERQLQAVAAACCAELLGAAGAAAHELRWQLQADERHLLICAMPRDVLEMLRECLAEHDMELRSATPQLCNTWNRHSRELGGGSAVLALANASSATVACLQDGAIAALARFGLSAGASIAALDAQVNRLQASLGLGADAHSRYLLVSERAVSPKALERWTLLSSEAAAAAQGSAA